jgi:uncharacterized membrane protein
MHIVKENVIVFVLTTLVFFGIDLLWLGFAGKGIYDHFLGHLLAENVNWTAALVFYFLYITGIFYFAIDPAYKQKSVLIALKNGAFFGFYCYATFELTSLAVLAEWPLGIVFIDILWGIVLTASVAWAGAAIKFRLKRTV